jgi:amidohydrolase
MNLKADRVFADMVAVRRRLHEYPEIGYRERKTAQIVIDELRRLGLGLDYGGVGGGIVARVEGRSRQAPRVALRAELDALPIAEDTGLPFASRHPGFMHACGHDGHMAMLLGAAALLRDDPPPGDTVLIFQPAEEGGKGAEVMVRAGALEGVSRIFAGHMTRHYRVGQIMIPQGLVSARADRLKFHLRGRGGHGARPHEGSDTVIPAAALIMALQALVTRETDPFQPSVVSIGTMRAGSAHNAIADTAELDGIIRTAGPAVRERIVGGIQRMAEALGKTYDTGIAAEIIELFPAVVNDPEEVELARSAARAVVGEERVLIDEMPSMGAEDFSFYLAQIPGCYARFGARREGEPDIPLHSPRFDFAEDLLPVGASYFDQVVRMAMQQLCGDCADSSSDRDLAAEAAAVDQLDGPDSRKVHGTAEHQ